MSLALLFENVTFQYSGQTASLLDIARLEIESGQRVFIEGPSGSGKTTLLGLMTGVLGPTRGLVQVLGENLTAKSGPERDHFRAQHIGYIFQTFNLIPYLKAIDNILLAGRFSKTRNERGRPQLEELTRRLNITDILQKPAHQLSIGQQQRVAAARALFGRPEIIIADEPTSSLDSENQQSFLKLLFDEVEMTKATLIFVSHNEMLRKEFSRSIFMKDLRGQ